MHPTVLQTRIPGLDQAAQAIEAQDNVAKAASDAKLRDFLQEVLENAEAYAESLQDPSETNRRKSELLRSGVNGSDVMGIRTIGDVKQLMMSLSDIKLVISGDENDNVDVYEAVMPKTRKAYAAYASLTEIGSLYGDPVLSTVQCKLGRWDGDVYLCTVQRVLTNVLTIHVRKDGSGVDQLAQWFAGRDVKTRVIAKAGDVVVRCGVDIKPLEEQRAIADAKKTQRAANWGNRSVQASNRRDK